MTEKTVVVHVSNETHQRLKALAKKEKRFLYGVMEEALERYLNRSDELVGHSHSDHIKEIDEIIHSGAFIHD